MCVLDSSHILSAISVLRIVKKRVGMGACVKALTRTCRYGVCQSLRVSMLAWNSMCQRLRVTRNLADQSGTSALHIFHL